MRFFKFLRPLNLGLVLAFLVACGGGGGGGGDTGGGFSTPAPIATSLTAGAGTITNGSSTTLTPTFSGGTGVITPGNTTVTSGVATTVTPSTTTTYTLTVTNAAGTTATTTTSVTVVAAPVATSLTAGAGTITNGSSTTLTPVFSDGTGIITPGNTSVTSGTPITVSPTTTTTYTLTVTNSLGTSATRSVQIQVAATSITFNISTGGSLRVTSSLTGITTTLTGLSTVFYDLNDTLSLTALPNTEEYLFNGWTGLVEDPYKLINTASISTTPGSFQQSVLFTLRKIGTKLIRSEFGNESLLNYRTSSNFIVWWFKNLDDRVGKANNRANAKDVLRWLEITWSKAGSKGMRGPAGSETYYINVYLWNDGDSFPYRGQGVGTDLYGLPLYSAPSGYPAVIEDVYTASTGNVVHEAFHIMQYYYGNVDRVFSYGGDTGWNTEATAVWWEISQSDWSYIRPGHENWYAQCASQIQFIIQPQMRLWALLGNGGETTWSRQGHGYGAGFLFHYLVKYLGVINEDFIPLSWQSKTSLSPLEYYIQNIPDFENWFRKISTYMVVFDKIPPGDKGALLKALETFTSAWYTDAVGNRKPDGTVDNNMYAFRLVDPGTTAWMRPVEKNQAWSYTTTLVESTLTTTSIYRIEFQSDTRGSNNTFSNFWVGTVVDNNGVFTYSTILLSSGSGSADIQVPAKGKLYVVAVSTPASYSGVETFDYQIKVSRQ